MTPVSPHHDTEVYASPHDAPWLNDPDMTFWRPGLGATLRMLRWQWLLVVATAVLTAVCVILFYFQWWWDAFKYGFKAIATVYAALIAATVAAVRDAVKKRSDPFCIRCGYSLHGLPDGHRCPECGLPFSLAVVREYQRDPANFIARWKGRHQHLPVGPPPVALDVPSNARRRPRSRDGT